MATAWSILTKIVVIFNSSKVGVVEILHVVIHGAFLLLVCSLIFVCHHAVVFERSGAQSMWAITAVATLVALGLSEITSNTAAASMPAGAHTAGGAARRGTFRPGP